MRSSSNTLSLPIIPASIQSRPAPEPDILCQLANKERIAFELGELSDEKFRKASGTMLRFRDLLWRHFYELPENTRTIIQNLYGACRIDVTFIPEISLRCHAAAITNFYEWLATRNRFIGVLAAAELPPNVASAIPSIRISEPSPHLWIEPAFGMHVVEPNLDIFKRKIRKTTSQNIRWNYCFIPLCH